MSLGSHRVRAITVSEVPGNENRDRNFRYFRLAVVPLVDCQRWRARCERGSRGHTVLARKRIFVFFKETAATLHATAIPNTVLAVQSKIILEYREIKRITDRFDCRLFFSSDSTPGRPVNRRDRG